MENKAIVTVNRPGEIESDKGVLVQNVIVRPVQRATQDIRKWREAMQAAEGYAGVRQYLYDLYEDILLDTFLTAAIRSRIAGVTKNKLRFVGADGKDVKGMEKLLEKSEFRKLRKKIQWAKMWGIGLMELSENPAKGFKVYNVPYKHIRPREGLIINEQSDASTGINYRTEPYNKYLLEVGEREDLGLLLKFAPYVIYKRGGFGDLAQFTELFGMPFRKGTYDGNDETTRFQLERALEMAGSASYAVIPKGGDIEFIESKSTGSSELYKLLIDACNGEICVGLLGQTQTMISSKNSGLAQGIVHADQMASISQDDCEDEVSILNENVIPILSRLGYPVEGGHFVYARVQKTPLKDAIKVDLALTKKIPISDDHFYTKYGIPKPKDYEKLKKAEAFNEVKQLVIEKAQEMFLAMLLDSQEDELLTKNINPMKNNTDTFFKELEKSNGKLMGAWDGLTPICSKIKEDKKLGEANNPDQIKGLSEANDYLKAQKAKK